MEIVARDERWGSSEFDPELALRAARAALADAAAPEPVTFELAVVLTSDAESRTLNQRWRGEDKPTNVLSFPDDAPHPADRADRPLGDLVLAYETVVREADDARRTLDEHVAHLVVHGVLHLLGFDHKSTVEADAMEARETKILAALGISDPYASDKEHPTAGARILP